MCAPLNGVDVVGKREHVLRKAVVVLQRDLDDVALDFLFDVDRGHVDSAKAAVQMLDEGQQATFEIEGVSGVREGDELVAGNLPLVALINQPDDDALVEEGQLTQAMSHRLPVEFELFEDIGIGIEPDQRSRATSLAAGGHGPEWLAARVFLIVRLSLAPDPRLRLD